MTVKDFTLSLFNIPFLYSGNRIELSRFAAREKIKIVDKEEGETHQLLGLVAIKHGKSLLYDNSYIVIGNPSRPNNLNMRWRGSNNKDNEPYFKSDEDLRKAYRAIMKMMFSENLKEILPWI